MALSIADTGYIMETGKVVMDGPAEKLLKDEDVKEFYLGLHAATETETATGATATRRKRRRGHAAQVVP